MLLPLPPDAAGRGSLSWRCCCWCPGLCCGELPLPGHATQRLPSSTARRTLSCLNQLMGVAQCCVRSPAPHTAPPHCPRCSELDLLKGSNRREQAGSARRALRRLHALTSMRDSFVRLQPAKEHAQVGGGWVDRLRAVGWVMEEWKGPAPGPHAAPYTHHTDSRSHRIISLA